MDNKITNRQFYTLTASFFMGNSLALAGGIRGGEKIGYITIFISYALFFCLCLLYGFIFKKLKSCDLFLICEKLLGKSFNKVLLTVVLIYSLFTSAVSTLELLFFIELSSDFSIKPVWIAFLFSLCLLSIFICGKKALARYSEIVLPFVIFIVAIVLFFGLEKANPSNLKIERLPEASYVLSSTFMNFVSPFSNIILVYFFASDLLSHEKIKRESLKSGLTALLVIASIYLTNLLIIGKNLMGSLYFPTLYTFGVINPSLFTQRSETVFLVTYMFFDILYVAVSYFVAVECAARIFLKKNTCSQKRKKVFFIGVPILSFIIMNLKADINGFYSAFAIIPFFVSAITLGIPVILTLASFKKASHSPPLNNNSRLQ